MNDDQLSEQAQLRYDSMKLADLESQVVRIHEMINYYNLAMEDDLTLSARVAYILGLVAIPGLHERQVVECPTCERNYTHVEGRETCMICYLDQMRKIDQLVGKE